MSKLTDTLGKLELAQIGWVVPDIHAALKFLQKTLRIDFPKPERYDGEQLNIKYYGYVVPGDGLMSQAYNGSAFIELIQPLSGKSLFHDYLKQHPAGGVQHLAFRLPVSGFDQVVQEITSQGYPVIGEVDHAIARMKFFDTYKDTGVATEIMGITDDGWKILEQMEK